MTNWKFFLLYWHSVPCAEGNAHSLWSYVEPGGTQASAYLLAYCRTMLALVFAASFIGKASNVSQFENTIRGFAIVPSGLSRSFAFVLLSTEFTVAAFLVAGGYFLVIGLVLAGILLVSFSTALISAMTRKLQHSCNCFGPSDKPISAVDLWRNSALLILALAGLATSILNANEASLTLADWVLIGLGAIASVALWMSLREILEIVRKG